MFAARAPLRVSWVVMVVAVVLEGFAWIRLIYIATTHGNHMLQNNNQQPCANRRQPPAASRRRCRSGSPCRLRVVWWWWQLVGGTLWLVMVVVVGCTRRSVGVLSPAWKGWPNVQSKAS